MEDQQGVFDMHERKRLESTRVFPLAPEGLGYGEGSISVVSQLESGELSAEALQTGGEIIMNDPDVFVPVDADANDDGCGDGRPTARVFRLIDTASGKVKEFFNKSRRRAKVFGGGLVVASSMWRSIAGEPDSGETVLGDRAFIAGELRKRGIAFGAHTDNHAEGEACGCGAIDKYPEITRNAVTRKDQITTVLRGLYGEAEFARHEAAIENVFGRYAVLGENDKYFSNASGRQSMELLLEEGAIIKELEDKHLEDFIVVNDVEGTTFDQRVFDQKMKERGVKGTAQAFVVDTWRGRMYADSVADIAREHLKDVNVELVGQEAYADFLIRTLAVAGTLTKNDQPVYGRVSSSKQDFALAA